MVRVLVLIGLSAICGGALAGETCKHDAATAREALARVYEGQKAHYQEKKTYSDDFGAIGFDPNIADDESDCDLANWSFDLEKVDSADHFRVTAYSRITREEFTIDESKDIKKKNEMKVSFTQEE